jgi:hypothetical protein
LKYVALTSVRNEERFISRTVAEMPGVIRLRLENPRHPTRGVNLAWALNAGLAKLKKLVPDWAYLLKVDGDSVLPPDYFSCLFEKFEKNHSLGLSSGSPTDEKVWRGRASDGAKIYRRECFNDIRHFVPCNAFDTLAMLQAKRYGWVVESFPDIKYIQLRTWRRGNINRWILSGRSRYYLGFPSWHTFLIGIVYLGDRPRFIGSLSMFLAHALTSIGGLSKPFPKDYYDFVSKYAVWETLERYHEKRLT